MSALLNLVVDLDDSTLVRAQAARATLAQAGFSVDLVPPGSDDAVLAWIDVAFGGAWSAEAYRGTTIVVRSGDRHVGFATIDSRGIDYVWLRDASFADAGIFGPFGVARAFRGGIAGSAILAIALGALRERGYARSLIPAVARGALSAYYERVASARPVAEFDLATQSARRLKTVVLASGSGTNFQAVADAVAAGRLQIDLTAVFCNRRDAFVLERAAKSGITAESVVWRRADETRAQYDARLHAAVAAHQPDPVLLLGWMHLLDRTFVESFPNVLNVHPAFLPHDPLADTVAFPDGMTLPVLRGAHAIDDAVRDGAPWSGVSVHVVTPATDRGEVVMRRPLPIVPASPLETVAREIHAIEHELVPAAIRTWLLRS